MRVPFLDLSAHHAPLRSEINAAIDEVIDCGAFAGGPYVTGFEERFAAYCRCQYVVGVGSGTDALWLALLALGVGPGDEVVTVPNTFMATAEAITYSGAKPVFVDVDALTYTMDPALLEEAITSRTKAIIPVHLFGQPADMNPILEIARSRGLAVIEQPLRPMVPNIRDAARERWAMRAALASIRERTLAPLERLARS